MAIEVTCEGCSAKYSVKDELAGKTAKCAKCGGKICIVAPAPVKKVRPATTKQKDFATDLGIVFSEDISAREISTLIDAALARESALAASEINIESHLKTVNECSDEELLDQFAERGTKGFLVSWDPEDDNSETLTLSIVGFGGSTTVQVFRAVSHIVGTQAENEGLDPLEWLMAHVSGDVDT